MYKQLITAPVVYPIEFEDVAAHMRIPYVAERDYVEKFIIPAVVDYCENELRRKLITQTWELVLPYFPNTQEILLPFPPLQEIVSVKYLDTDGNEITFSSADYYLTNAIGSEGYSPDIYGALVLKENISWPSTKNIRTAVKIRFTCGYGDTGESLPPTLRIALLQLSAHWMNNRDVLASDYSAPQIVPMHIKNILWQHSLGDG
jgi:uncharacterized phiE125 gp8 family phage protein